MSSHRLSAPLLALLALLMLTRPALAHHSFAMYDSEKLLKLEGTVKEFQWTNPHAIVWINGRTSSDQPEELWTVELPTSPGNLSRMGWKRNSLAPGDPVVLEINPLRDGRRGGSFKKATNTSTGAVLVASVRDEPPGAGGAAPEEQHDHEHEHDSGCAIGAGREGTSRWLGLAGLAAFARRRRAFRGSGSA